METALETLEEKDSLMYASATMLYSLIELDTNNVQKALESFLLAFSIRQLLMDPDDAFIASSLNALSIAYTELCDFDKAVKTGQQAIDIRLRTKSDRIGNSCNNMASLLMRMARPMKPKKCSRNAHL
jgi:tetratricopeptide (TPR) repeat protein